MKLTERITQLLNKAIKEEKRFSQVELAEKMEVAPASVNKWMTGGSPSIDKLPKLCEILEISPNVLFDYHANEDDIETEKLLKKFKQLPEYRPIIEKLLSQIVKDFSPTVENS